MGSGSETERGEPDGRARGPTEWPRARRSRLGRPELVSGRRIFAGGCRAGGAEGAKNRIFATAAQPARKPPAKIRLELTSEGRPSLRRRARTYGGGPEAMEEEPRALPSGSKRGVERTDAHRSALRATISGPIYGKTKL